MQSKAPKKLYKKIIVPLVGPIVHLMHLKIHGHRVFINKYTLRISFVSKIVKYVQTKLEFSRIKLERDTEYKKWVKKKYPSKQTLKQQRKLQTNFKKRPKISLLMPTYNTDPKFLREAIQSVTNQTYDNWQLCIADDASTDTEVVEIIKEFAAKDKRISYMVRESNGHICEASNSALGLADGSYIGLLDHDDVLWPNALYEVIKLINQNPEAKFIYSDEDKTDETSKKHFEPFFKPDWSPEFLRSINYITHFAVLETKLVNQVGKFRKGYEGAQDWDLFLRASRQVKQVYHIPTVLYSWRISLNSTALTPTAKDYAYVNQKKALQDDLNQRNLKAKLSWEIPFSMWKIDYELKSKPLVSIIIPTKDQLTLVAQCLQSIIEKTTYSNYELVIVDTGSSDIAVWQLYEKTKKQLPNTKIVNYKNKFNFSSACNVGAKNAKGEQLLFLNNDTEVISNSWLQDMLGYAEQQGIGAVGCKLYYPNSKLQHAGIILGVGGRNGTPGIAGHFFPAFEDEPPQDPAQQLYIGGTRNFAAVTAACVMVSKKKFNKVGGFDPKFRIAFNDVDFCLKLFNQGWRNVYLPHVTLYHHESISIGQPGSKERDLNEFSKEIRMMLKKWKPLIENDPFYHPAFRRDIASARIRLR